MKYIADSLKPSQRLRLKLTGLHRKFNNLMELVKDATWYDVWFWVIGVYVLYHGALYLAALIIGKWYPK